MAGDSNIIYWLTSRGYDATPDRVALIRTAAKSTNLLLSDEEILQVVGPAP